MSEEFERELAVVLNRYSVENGSNTPDFLLAKILRVQIVVWNEAVRARDAWYGVDLRPGVPR